MNTLLGGGPDLFGVVFRIWRSEQPVLGLFLGFGEVSRTVLGSFLGFGGGEQDCFGSFLGFGSSESTRSSRD